MRDVKAEIREFLTTRRAKITPEEAGLPACSGKRRVPGLRREEVASMTGISIEYYTRLERGAATGVSDSVLEALADALRLDDAERAHLWDLIRAANAAGPRRRRPPRRQVRPVVQRMLDAMATTPAFVLNGRLDILAANQLGRALYAPMYEDAERPVNHARFLFLDPAAADLWRDWDETAEETAPSGGRRP